MTGGNVQMTVNWQRSLFNILNYNLWSIHDEWRINAHWHCLPPTKPYGVEPTYRSMLHTGLDNKLSATINSVKANPESRSTSLGSSSLVRVHVTWPLFYGKIPVNLLVDTWEFASRSLSKKAAFCRRSPEDCSILDIQFDTVLLLSCCYLCCFSSCPPKPPL